MGATLLLTLGALVAFLCWQFYVIGADIAQARGQPRGWGSLTLVTGPIGVLLLYALLEDKRQPAQAPPSQPLARRSPRSQSPTPPRSARPPDPHPPVEPPPGPAQRH
jgi:hypothetical protein